MFLTTHTVVSFATLKITQNPIALFILNFLLHYVLDAIPHGDWGYIKGFKNQKINYILMAFLDMLFVIIITISYLNSNTYSDIAILSAIIGSILPDILWGLYDLTKIKILKIFEIIDGFVHKLLGVQEEQKIYFLVQLLFIGIAILFI